MECGVESALLEMEVAEAALFNLLDDAVAVHGLFGEEGEEKGFRVALEEFFLIHGKSRRWW